MIEPSAKARNFHYRDITVGMKHSHQYVITKKVYDSFVATFEDQSPVHMSDAYGRACGFDGRVMHGTILNGFLSHFVGMYFPGASSLLLSVDMRFLDPCYVEDRVNLEAEVMQKTEAVNAIMLNVTFQNLTKKRTAARARVQVRLKDVP